MFVNTNYRNWKILVFFSFVSLTACDGAREAMGIAKQSPDEFSIVTRAPLSLPPDYGLRPPKPGLKRPQEESIKERARIRLLSRRKDKNTTSSTNLLSSSESALLQKAGAVNADPSIRRIINRESSILAVENQNFADKLIFWKGRPEPGTIVNAPAEDKRLRENLALGDAPTKGRSPQIGRKPKGWLEGLMK